MERHVIIPEPLFAQLVTYLGAPRTMIIHLNGCIADDGTQIAGISPDSTSKIRMEDVPIGTLFYGRVLTSWSPAIGNFYRDETSIGGVGSGDNWKICTYGKLLIFDYKVLMTTKETR